MKLNKYILTLCLSAAAVAMPMAMMAVSAPAAAELSVQETPQVKVQQGGIAIEIPGDNQRHIAIYAITGQVLKQFNANPGSTFVELPAGYYIVRIDHLSVKVVVK